MFNVPLPRAFGLIDHPFKTLDLPIAPIAFRLVLKLLTENAPRRSLSTADGGPGALLTIVATLIVDAASHAASRQFLWHIPTGGVWKSTK